LNRGRTLPLIIGRNIGDFGV